MVRKTAVVDMSRCVACGACTRACPNEAIFVYKGCYAKTDPERCVGCRKCARVCPVGCIEFWDKGAAV